MEHFLGSETAWAFWSFKSDRTLRDLSTGTFTGWVYREGSEADGVDLTGTFAGAVGAGVEPTGTPNLTYTPATNEFVAAGIVTPGPWKLRVRWSSGDTVVFDGPITIRAQVI